MTDDKNENLGSDKTMPLSKRLRLPSNCRYVTAARAGTVIAVVGAERPSRNADFEAVRALGPADKCTDVTAERAGKMIAVVAPARAPKSTVAPPQPPADEDRFNPSQTGLAARLLPGISFYLDAVCLPPLR